jgi:hypothetical protein
VRGEGWRLNHEIFGREREIVGDREKDGGRESVGVRESVRERVGERVESKRILRSIRARVCDLHQDVLRDV